MPRAGGLLDQPARWVEGIEEIEAVLEEPEPTKGPPKTRPKGKQRRRNV